MTGPGKKYPSLYACELKTRQKCVYGNRSHEYYIWGSTIGTGWVELKNRERMDLKINVVQRGMGVIHRDLANLHRDQVQPLLFRHLKGVNFVAVRTARR